MDGWMDGWIIQLKLSMQDEGKKHTYDSHAFIHLSFCLFGSFHGKVRIFGFIGAFHLTLRGNLFLG